METSFLNNYSKIIIFIVLSIIISVFLGDNVLYWFLLLVLIGQVLLNIDRIKSNLSKL